MPRAGLIPTQGTLERVKFDQLLAFIATEIVQKHIPLMRKLLTEAAWQGVRHSPEIRAYFERIQRADPARKKIALVATARIASSA